MLGFAFFRHRREGFAPRTPAAALRALGLGVLPEEAFVYLSTSQKPLDEEPFDLEEIERVLARKDLDLETNILLKGILEKLVSGGEQETSLFGAEGINLLEARYIDRIEELRRTLKEQGTASGAQSAASGAQGTASGAQSAASGAQSAASGAQSAASGAQSAALRATARCYYELALLHAKTRSIKTFYLKEAYSSFRDSLRGLKRMTRGELRLFIEVLVELGLYDHAARILSGVQDTPGTPDPEVLLLKAEVAYHRRDFTEVLRVCRLLSESRAALQPGVRRLVSYWLAAS